MDLLIICYTVIVVTILGTLPENKKEEWNKTFVYAFFWPVFLALLIIKFLIWLLHNFIKEFYKMLKS